VALWVLWHVCAYVRVREWGCGSGSGSSLTSAPAPNGPNVILSIIGGNVNGLKSYGNMAALVTVAEILRALQAETNFQKQT
jgi:hypothetical protein